MSQAFDQYPRFEHGSPSAQYAQVSNFSVNYLEGLLVNLMHMELPVGLEKPADSYLELQSKLRSRERTIRHAFQFQIEKLFNEFKLIRRSRLNANTARDWQSLGLAGQNSSRVLSRIEAISDKYQRQFAQRLDTLSRRLKVLVHRSGDSKDEHPLAPINLCNAFYSSVDALNLTSLQTCQLFELFDQILADQLDNFYIQIDLGMYYLDILPELTDPELFTESESGKAENVASSGDDTEFIDAAEFEREQALAVAFGGHEPQPVTDDQVPVTAQEPEPTPVKSEEATGTKPDQLKPAETEPGVIDREFEDTTSTRVNLESRDLPERSARADGVAPEAISSGTGPAPAGAKSADADSAQTASDQTAVIADTPAELTLREHLLIFRERTDEVCKDYAKRFNALLLTIEKFLDQEQLEKLHKFAHYYSNLLSNPLLSQPLARQMARLSSVLVELILFEDDFFLTDSHPANDFLQSVVDFEIRCKHQEHNLQILTGFIDSLRRLDRPGSHDFGLVLQTYDAMKRSEMDYMSRQKEEQDKYEKFLSSSILKLVNQITEKLLVEPETLAFFYDDWQLLLLQIARKIGIDSKEFEQSVDIARMLAWSLDENRDPSHPKYSNLSFTAILKAIDHGLEVMNFSSEHRHRTRKLLVKEFKRKNDKTRISIISTTPPRPTAAIDMFSETIRKHSSRLTDMTTGIKVIPRLLIQTIQASEMELGTWVEIKLGRSKTYKRAKLKWKSRDNDQFVFVDQRGHKISQLNESELDRDLAAGTIKLLNTSSLLPSGQPRLSRGFHHFSHD